MYISIIAKSKICLVFIEYGWNECYNMNIEKKLDQNNTCIMKGRKIMLAAVKGYYDGNHIVISEDDRKNLNAGDEVIVTILDKINGKKVDTRTEKRRRFIELEEFVCYSGRSTEEVEGYIKEMRSNDTL